MYDIIILNLRERYRNTDWDILVVVVRMRREDDARMMSWPAELFHLSASKSVAQAVSRLVGRGYRCPAGSGGH